LSADDDDSWISDADYGPSCIDTFDDLGG